MIYLIHNQMDSCLNIMGLRYQVIALEDSVKNDPIKVRTEEEGPDPRMKRLGVVEAKYDSKFYHESAMAECFNTIRIHATEMGLNEICIQFNPDYLHHER